MRHVVFFYRREVEEGRGGVYSGRDGADEVEERYACADECEGRGVDAGLEEPAVLLEDVHVDIDLGARVERGLDDGFEGRFYGGG